MKRVLWHQALYAVAMSVTLVACGAPPKNLANAPAGPLSNPAVGSAQEAGRPHAHYALKQLIAPPPALAFHLPHQIFAFPGRAMCFTSGYVNGERCRVEVFREDAILPANPTDPTLPPAILLGSAEAVTDLTTGVTINHPGGVCFTKGVTPSMLPGDIIKVTKIDINGNPIAPPEEHQMADVQAGIARQIGTDVIVKGNALDLHGHQFPLDQIEHRLISSAKFPFQANGTRTLRASIAAAVAGTLAYDNPADPTDGRWTATYKGLSPLDIIKAQQSTSTCLWKGNIPVPLTETTSGENFGVPVGAPFGPTCRIYGYNGIIRDDQTLYINKNYLAAPVPIPLDGQAMSNVSNVDVFLRDPLAPGLNFTPTGCRVGSDKTWTFTLQPSDVLGLPDGKIAFDVLYTIPSTIPGTPDSTIRGTAFSIVKDTVAPVVTASADANPFTTSTNITLANSKPAADTFFTLDGTVPTVNSTHYTVPINVTATTTVNYMSLDPAGNTTTGSFTATRVPLVTFSPPGGQFTTPQAVTLSTDLPANIFFTLGAPPVAPLVGTAYVPGSAINIGATNNLNVWTVDAAGTTSPVITANYTINTLAVTATPAGGSFNGPQLVTLASNRVGAALFFTLDGTSPLAANGISPSLTALPFKLPGISIATPNVITTLKFVAIAGGQASFVGSLDFGLNFTIPSVTANPSVPLPAVFNRLIAGTLNTIKLSSNGPGATFFFTLSPTANPTTRYNPATGIVIPPAPPKTIITLRYKAVDQFGNASAIGTSLYHF
jgi:hypothetical protein